MKRESGILLHISSLPNEFGIGSFGNEAYEFIDFLVKANQKYWQILPMGHTGYGNSPYQCFSAFAGNPNFISFDILNKKGYLKTEDYKNEKYYYEKEKIDYGLIFNIRNKVLKIAYENFKKYKNEEFEIFKKENEFWLNEYSFYMSLKEEFDLKSYVNWDDELIKNRNEKKLNEYKEKLKDKIGYYEFIQFEFFNQWKRLKNYANKKGIKIIGDIPIYVSEDSVDLWSNPKNFKVDENNKLKVVAGCPPDYFSKDGQLWGNPIYNWDEMKKDGFSWWIERIRKNFELYDVLRIDHFRGFESYYEIPYKSKNAINGNWVKGPGIELFNKVKEKLGEVNIIAEDLGYLTNEVIEFRNKTGFPGMKVLEFAFDEDENDYLPHNYIWNSVSYLGTHDNATIIDWFYSIGFSERKKVIEYFKLDKTEGINFGLIRGLLSSVSKLTIITMQDLLGIGKEGRMNIPSVPNDNWTWRIKKEDLNLELAKKLEKLTYLYGRNLI